LNTILHFVLSETIYVNDEYSDKYLFLIKLKIKTMMLNIIDVRLTPRKIVPIFSCR